MDLKKLHREHGQSVWLDYIGPDTVDTIPPATLVAMRDHGTAQGRLEENLDDARKVLEALARCGISIDDLTARLLDDGVGKFSAAFDTLLASIDKKLHPPSAHHALPA
jgi:transaldolase/glucose-6-phosphate isomerase